MGMREEYQALMEKQLNEWRNQAENFKASAAHLEVHAREQYEKNLAYLRAKQDEASQQFAKLKDASESAWAQWRTRMEEAGKDVGAAIERMTRPK
jgi:hypothetical protein